MAIRGSRRTWTEVILFSIGALLIFQALYYNLMAETPGEVLFNLTVNRAGPSFMIQAEGSRKIYQQQFEFNGARVSFTGDIQGDHVSIKGSMRSELEGEAPRDFTAVGSIADNRAVVPLMSPKGSRIGKISLSITAQ